MRFLFLFLTFFVCCTAIPMAVPRLVIFIVIDQLGMNIFDRYKNEFKDGFHELLENGAYFTNVNFNSVPTVTAVGHATLATGRNPSYHGIVGNYWWDRGKRKKVYAPSSPAFELGPEQLMVPTLGDVLKENMQFAKVASISMKDRSAIMMGGKEADVAIWFDPEKSEFATSQYYWPPPPWLNEFNKRLPEWGVPDKTEKYLFKKKFLASKKADELVFNLAIKTSEEMGLGVDEYPDILFIGFSALDRLGHRIGPSGEKVWEHLQQLDAFIKGIMNYVNQKVGSENFTIVLTSDHGVLPTPQRYKRINPIQFKKVIEGNLQNYKPLSGPNWILNISRPHIYLNRDQSERLNLDWPNFLETTAAFIRQFKGVEKVYIPMNFGEDPYSETFMRGYHEQRGGDLLVRFREDYLFKSSSKGSSHGSPYQYDTHVPLFSMEKIFEPVDLIRGCWLLMWPQRSLNYWGLKWNWNTSRKLSARFLSKSKFTHNIFNIQNILI